MHLQTVVKNARDLTGIDPNLLMEQVKSTTTYLPQISAETPQRSYLAHLQQKSGQKLEGLTLSEYFHLCLCAHWATAGTYVPTDVDNLIRYKLWRVPNQAEETQRMFALTLEAFDWDYGPVSGKIVHHGRERVATHEGTWFSVAMGAYGHAVWKKDLKQKLILEEIVIQEIFREEKMLKDFFQEQDGVNFLRASSLIAHNLGDLDRILEQWKIPADNRLMKEVHRAGHEKKKLFSGILVAMGEVNKAHMAAENHRHFALRKVKKLRTKENYLLPLCPFLDQWGKNLAQDPDLSDEDKAEIVRALYEGWAYLPTTHAYPRGARGLIENWPSARKKLANLLPSKLNKELFSGKFYELYCVDEEKFMRHWQRLAFLNKKLFH